MRVQQQTSSYAVQHPSKTDALSVAFEHPACSTDVNVMCAAASTCRAWRNAMQLGCPCSIDVVLNEAPPVQLQSLASWLLKHAPLVRCITLQGISCRTCLAEYQADCRACVQQLTRALQQSASGAASHAPSGSSAGQPQQQHGLQLVSFSSDFLASAAVLAALPAHSLTQLDVGWRRTYGIGATTSGPTVAKALTRLSNLQRLRICNSDANRNMPACLHSVAQLSQLTSLTLHGEWRRGGKALEQLMQQPLPLRQLQLDLGLGWYELPKLDMSGLSYLTEFVTSSSLYPGVVLPFQLKCLQLGKCKTADELAPVMLLQHLQQLRLRMEFGADQQPLLQLAQLPALQQLSLEYKCAFDAAAAAPAWPQLPQLCELQLQFEDGCFHYRRDMAAILGGVAASTGLTKLQMEAWAARPSYGHGLPYPDEDEVCSDDDLEPELCSVAACGSLTGLTRLQDLYIGGGTGLSELEPGDALALTALAGLTRLVLKVQRDGVGDEATAALASTLTGLRHLDLPAAAL